MGVSMSEEITVRSVGEDVTHTASSPSEFELTPFEFREESESAGRSRRSEPEPEPVEVQASTEPAREAPQRPLLLALVDEIVEFLARLWNRLRSL